VIELNITKVTEQAKYSYSDGYAEMTFVMSA